MTFSYADLLSLENILADAIMYVGDPGMKILNKGYYLRQAKAGLDEMGFETFFDLRYQDIEITENLQIPMPSGAWNIRDLFVFNTYVSVTDNVTSDTTISSCCQIAESRRLVHKQNFLTRGYESGYTARNKSNQWDYFVIPFSQDNVLYFYNVQNGMIMLSDYCKPWKYLRIVYNGTPSDIDKTKMIPPFIRNAIVGYVTERCLFAIKSRDKTKRIDWMDARADLYTKAGPTTASKWDEAKYRLKSMDKKQADDLKEYLSRAAW